MFHSLHTTEPGQQPKPYSLTPALRENVLIDVVEAWRRPLHVVERSTLDLDRDREAVFLFSLDLDH